MKTIFRTAFYLRSNYVNKEGNTLLWLGFTSIVSVYPLALLASPLMRSWDKEKERLKGRSTEALSTNLQLDNIQNGLLNIFRRLEFSMNFR